jgi:hypothetical protein
MVKEIGWAEPTHKCHRELPQQKWLNPGRKWAGRVVECSCGKAYVWAYHGYSEHWGWSLLEHSTDWVYKG